MDLEVSCTQYFRNIGQLSCRRDVTSNSYFQVEMISTNYASMELYTKIQRWHSRDVNPSLNLNFHYENMSVKFIL